VGWTDRFSDFVGEIKTIDDGYPFPKMWQHYDTREPHGNVFPCHNHCILCDAGFDKYENYLKSTIVSHVKRCLQWRDGEVVWDLAYAAPHEVVVVSLRKLRRH